MTKLEIADQAEQRPQNCGTGYCSCIECPYEAEQAEQEPVAWKKCAFCGIEHQIKSDGYILDTKTDEVFCRKCYVHTHEQEPVVWTATRLWNRKDTWKCSADIEKDLLYTAPQPVKQEPVAWANIDLDAMVKAFDTVIEAQAFKDNPFHNPINSNAMVALRILRGLIPAMKSYAAPVRTKDLTDDEINALIDKSWIESMTKKEFARAVIASDREKNK